MGAVMGRARVLEEIRIMRFEEVLDRHERGYLTQAEAGEMLGMSERSFRRWQGRYREAGAAGLVDRRVGQPSPRRADAGELGRAQALYAEMYDGFTAKHFHEKLVERHGYRLGYTVTRLALQAAGLMKRAPRRGAHRRRRPRRPLPGMLLHQDAARHAWLAGRPPLDLVVTLDDATSAIYSAILVEEEGTASSFRSLCEVVADRGLFCSLYTDRGSHYFHTPVAGGGVDREHPTQVGRALAQLGIEHIAAYSPQARGRSERAFRTLQDRLPKELALAGITDLEAANAWLRATGLPAHNARFAVPAEEPGTAFVPAAARAMARRALPPGDPAGRQRQLRALEGPQPADPEEPAPAALRPRHRATARISRRRRRALLGAAPRRRLPAPRGRPP